MFLWYPWLFARDLGQASFSSKLCTCEGLVVYAAFFLVVGLGVMD